MNAPELRAQAPPVLHQYPHLTQEFADTLTQATTQNSIVFQNGTPATFTVPHAHNYPDYSGLQQFASYPLPRFWRSNSLMPNVALLNPVGLIDVHTQGYAISEAEHVNISLELARNWNYYFNVANNTKSGLDDITVALIDEANKPQNRNLPRFANTFWAQISPNRPYPTPIVNRPLSGNEPIPGFINTCLPIGSLQRYRVPLYDGNKPRFYDEDDCLDFPDGTRDAYNNPNYVTVSMCETPKIQSNYLANSYYLYKDGVVNDPLTNTTDVTTGHWYKKNGINGFFRDGTTFYFRKDIRNYQLCLNRHPDYEYAHKLLSPVAPLFAFEKDADLHHYYIRLLTSSTLNPSHTLLPRPNGRTIDMLLENGEVETMIDFGTYQNLSVQNNNLYTSTLRHFYAFTPIVKRAYINAYPSDTTVANVQQLHDFQTKGMVDRYNTYLSKTRANAANLKLQGCLYTIYNMDGQRSYRYEWDVVRKATSQIRGQRYSTPDFYPFKVWWKKGCCAFEGIDRIIESRNEELRNNPDRLFSPFVAAGWNPDENYNKRPAQWLGLMKTIGNMGAEFFYVGHFGNDGNQFRDFNHHVNHTPNCTTTTGQCYNPGSNFSPNGVPRQERMAPSSNTNRGSFLLGNFAWQYVMPIYAQASFSRAEDLLLNGNLEKGLGTYNANTNTIDYQYNMPVLGITNKSIAQNYQTYVAAPSTTPTPRTFVTIRNKANEFLIATTLQPNEMPGDTTISVYNPNTNKFEDVNYQRSFLSYQDKQANVEADIEINFNTVLGSSLIVHARRQGSLYVLDQTNPTNVIFYQLDGWHEWKHPMWWSKDFLIEGELFDATVGTPELKTHDIVGNDLTQAFTSVSSPGSAIQIEYDFKPRETGDYHIFVRFRANTTDIIRGELDGQPFSIYFEDSCAGNWVWMEADTTVNIAANGSYNLLLDNISENIQIDKIFISKDNHLPTELGLLCYNR